MKEENAVEPKVSSPSGRASRRALLMIAALVAIGVVVLTAKSRSTGALDLMLKIGEESSHEQCVRVSRAVLDQTDPSYESLLGAFHGQPSLKVGMVGPDGTPKVIRLDGNERKVASAMAKWVAKFRDSKRLKLKGAHKTGEKPDGDTLVLFPDNAVAVLGYSDSGTKSQSSCGVKAWFFPVQGNIHPAADMAVKEMAGMANPCPCPGVSPAPPPYKWSAEIHSQDCGSVCDSLGYPNYQPVSKVPGPYVCSADAGHHGFRGGFLNGAIGDKYCHLTFASNAGKDYDYKCLCEEENAGGIKYEWRSSSDPAEPDCSDVCSAKGYEALETGEVYSDANQMFYLCFGNYGHLGYVPGWTMKHTNSGFRRCHSAYNSNGHYLEGIKTSFYCACV